MTLTELEQLERAATDAALVAGMRNALPHLLRVARAADNLVDCDDDLERMALRSAVEQMRQALK